MDVFLLFLLKNSGFQNFGASQLFFLICCDQQNKLRNEKKPSYVLYIGDSYTTQLYGDYFINHEILRIPIDQPVIIMESKGPRVFPPAAAGFMGLTGRCEETSASWWNSWR